MHTVILPRLGTFDAWRDAARSFAGSEVPPQNIAWRLEGTAPSLFDDDVPTPSGGHRAVTVPKDFPALARQLCAARMPGAFDLAYRLLLRVSLHPRLLANRADKDVDEAERIAKLIRRDMHKMKAFVRFREVGQGDAPRRRFVAWFEPSHRIEELTSGFFARRFADMDWAIVTPEVTVRFEDGALSHQALAATAPDLVDETEELWRTYYAHIFNPARLKISAMTSEMPKKYWKNLPEAALIPDLIAGAEARAAEMRAAAPSLPPVRTERVLARIPARANTSEDLSSCARCPLAGPTTQAVPGAGPRDADLMIVGEQPGDREDIEGRPFVGPAGQMFDRLAADVGLDRESAYVTNAVKHFKFLVRGKRRIHQTPSSGEVEHCRWWLTREIAEVQPRLILALGATAALALTGNGKGVMRRRGQIEAGLDGVPVFLTLHPAALLRHPDPETREANITLVRADLAEVARLVGQPLSEAEHFSTEPLKAVRFQA